MKIIFIFHRKGCKEKNNGRNRMQGSGKKIWDEGFAEWGEPVSGKTENHRAGGAERKWKDDAHQAD